MSRASALAYANAWLEARLRLGDEVWTRPRPNEAFRIGGACWTVHVGDTMFGTVVHTADSGHFTWFTAVRLGGLPQAFAASIWTTRPAALTSWLRNGVLQLPPESPLLPRVHPDVLMPFKVPARQPLGRQLSPTRVRVAEVGVVAARALVDDCGGAAVVARALGIGESTVRHWLRGTRALPRVHVEALVDLSCGAL